MTKKPRFMKYYDPSGRVVNLNLCSFCVNLPDFDKGVECRYAAEICEDKCPGFMKVENINQRVDFQGDVTK